MFVVRTQLTRLGTPCAWDALARFEVLERAGKRPVVTTVGGRRMAPSALERWIATLPVETLRKACP